MSANERKNMRADRIRRCLSSGPTIEQWLHLNHVGRSSLYKRMADFHKSEPDRFPRRSSMASNWISATRSGIADAQAIAPASIAPSLTTEVANRQRALLAMAAPCAAIRRLRACLLPISWLMAVRVTQRSEYPLGGTRASFIRLVFVCAI